ncbi:U3 small nucleolar RNA-associated protein 14 homolog A [Rhagoletis pomonella]|uniref:U3 small nucleolar RNA-associated protein 14 homolog A n=1 Tax=Rhagoletis pomonella TaxID=28610 RepID=UPI00177BEFD2|nr:U3 small nucleolar RNA-associated protein 14 homolog A [Rhagoletis pomonella]
MSDDEEQFNPKAHKKLLQGISNLGKVQHIRRTTRNEPIKQQDEFQLVKPAVESVARHPVGIHDIVKVLKTTKRHIDAGKQLKVVQSSKKVLAKPLEKPQAERIKRGLGYEKAKKNLEQWDAVVAQNRNAETQVFPLRSETIYVDTSLHRAPLQRSLKSELALELEAEQARLKAAKRALAGETENEEEQVKREEEMLQRKLTRDELIARRRELAYLKIRESQKSLKARKQNKIKSKKYHKLLKREKMQDQIKQFEILQKTNPEAALEKLNELEKSRVLERASLRHKNTGTWAKNLQIRAKYDKDVRKDLAEQLHISRQLTQKKNDTENEDEDDKLTKTSQIEIEKEVNDSDPFNPWTRVGNLQNEIRPSEREGENWRKYWLERNENDKMLHEYKKLLAEEGNERSNDGGDEERPARSDEEQKMEHELAYTYGTEKCKAVSKDTSIKKKKIKTKTENKQLKQINKKSVQVKQENNENLTKERVVEDINKRDSTNVPNSNTENNIDDIFDKQEDKIKRKMTKKLKELQKKAKLLQKSQSKDKKNKNRKKKDELKNLKDLAFKIEVKRPVIDEELNNDSLEGSNAEVDLNKIVTEVDNSKSLQQARNKAKKPSYVPTSSDNNTIATIDPNKLADVKLKHNVNNFIGLNDTLAVDDDIDMSDGDEQERMHMDQQMTISEAFEDDDIIADFTNDKKKDTEITNAEIDLFMPGWGSWAGAGISAEQQNANKNKRLVLKLAKKEKRRDDNKGSLYINESASKQLRTHLVSDVPFPFTSVAEYEASIRATIGRNCVPETAFRMLTRPAVITHKGQIIEPMDKSELMKPQRKLRHVVDKRIARMQEVNGPEAITTK